MALTKAEKWSAIRVPFVITIVIMAVLTVRIVSVWPELPQTMGSHFAANGQPNDFMSKAGFFWTMGLIGGGTVLLLFGVTIFLRKLPPHMINLPNREYWLATPERQQEALDRLGSLVGWMSMATAALVAVAIEFAIEANLHGTGFANGPFVVCLIVYFIFTVGFAIRKTQSLSIPDADPA